MDATLVTTEADEAVRGLVGRRAEPAVTLTLPLEQPLAARPDTGPRLRALVDRALTAVRAGWGDAAAEAVRAAVEQAGGIEVDPRAEHARGLLLAAEPGGCTVVRLPVAVPERASVGRAYAVTAALQALAAAPRYRVLVLDGHRATLHVGRGATTEPDAAGGFPLHVEPPREWDTPHGDLPIHEEVRREQQRAVLRAVDAAVGRAQAEEPLPLVVAAPTRELALFDEVTHHGDRTAGTVAGNLAHAGGPALAAAAAPVLAAHRANACAAAVAAVREGVGSGEAVAGIADVAAAALARRGRVLVVEDGARALAAGVDALGAAPGADGPPAHEDAVDAVVEAVLLAGGSVVFVEAGDLADLGGVALLVRW